MGFKDIINKFKKDPSGRNEEVKKHYLTGKEVRVIAKANAKEMRRLERAKRRSVPESEYKSEMKDANNILEVENLHSYFFTDQGVVKAVNGVTFSIPVNSTVGVVGESGCGKSVTAMSVMRLLQGPSGQIVEGSIRFKAYDYKTDADGNPVPTYETDDKGEIVYETITNASGKEIKKPKIKEYEKVEAVYDIAKMPIKEMYRLRGRQISMVFQEPMTSLNPVFTIGNQLDEVTLLHIPGATKKSAKERSVKMLDMVGIAMPERVYASYPHELSGGMRQRVMIAMALACEPRLIIADEPTTALDVTIQAQILDLFNDLKKKINGSILLITHDLGVIAEMADYVVVMYAGRIIEQGTALEIFRNPLHPYTQGLQKSKPTMNSSSDTLYNIPGNVPNPINMPDYCYFKERCRSCIGKCSGEYPCMHQVSPTHFVACHLYESKED